MLIGYAIAVATPLVIYLYAETRDWLDINDPKRTDHDHLWSIAYKG